MRPCGRVVTNGRTFSFSLPFFPTLFTLRTTQRLKGSTREKPILGAVGRISILLLVYPRRRGSYRAATMSPVISTVRHCTLLPGERARERERERESIFVRSRAEFDNYAVAFLRNATAVFFRAIIVLSHFYSVDSFIRVRRIIILIL